MVADLPGVGEHLQDHLEVYIQYASKQPVSIAPGLRWRARPRIGVEWLFFRRGLGATNHFEGGGFVRSNDDVDYPNLMFHFLPIAIRYDGSAPTEGHGYQVHIGPMYSDARGSVKIKSTDPTAAPGAALQLPVHRPGPPGVGGVDPGGPAHPHPARVRPVQRGRAVARARAWRPTRRSWTGWRKDAETALHPSCTARMGVDDQSVLDPLTMRVHGVDGLRVVDASSMPYVTNGNIYAPIMMLAEKSADLILGNTPLPPSTAPFYRYRDDSPLYPEQRAPRRRTAR